jgi:Trm5-related predicted tRNA methylase
MDRVSSTLEKSKINVILQRMEKTTWERRLLWEYNIKIVLRDTECEEDFSGSREGWAVRFYEHGSVKIS